MGKGKNKSGKQERRLATIILLTATVELIDKVLEILLRLFD